ncbi:MAG: WxcM-like domain-containing protein [Dysgonomonas sp.]
MEKEQIIELPKKEDRRGNLSFLEESGQLPFNIGRAYWIYNVPGGQKRGSHAFKTQEEVIIALSGSFDVVLDDGHEKRTYQLNRSYKAIHVPRMMWRTLENFSTNSVCLILTSLPYDDDDYIRNYKEFQKMVREEAIPPAVPPNKNKINCEPLFVSTANKNTVFDCSFIKLPVVKNRAGNITPVHNCVDIPFSIKRIFYIYDIPAGETRGVHSHKYCHEVLIAASGSFEIELDDGQNLRTVTLNHPMYGLHIPPGIWATEKNYSSGTVCLVLASDVYDEEDYIRTYSDFKKFRAND